MSDTRIQIYCKFENFRVTFISRIFIIRFFFEVLNSRTIVHVVLRDSLLARTLNSRYTEFANIRESKVLVNISELTVQMVPVEKLKQSISKWVLSKWG